MFEVGFTEIVLILGLALLVLGPEKLPGLAQKVGRWTGRARSMARQLRTQLEQEVTLDELSRSKPTQPNNPSSAPEPAPYPEPQNPPYPYPPAESSTQASQNSAESSAAAASTVTAGQEFSGGVPQPEPETTPVAAHETKHVQ